MSVGMRPTLNCSPLALAVGTFRVTYRCGRAAGVVGSENPPDWITVASLPTSSSGGELSPGRRATGPRARLSLDGLLALSYSGLLQGLALYRVCGHSRDSCGVHLARADPNDPRERLDEDLPVTHLAGAGRRDDRFDGRLHERLRHRHLEPYLLAEFEHEGPAAIVLLQLDLAAVAAHPTDRDARNAGPE